MFGLAANAVIRWDLPLPGKFVLMESTWTLTRGTTAKLREVQRREERRLIRGRNFVLFCAAAHGTARMNALPAERTSTGTYEFYHYSEGGRKSWIDQQNYTDKLSNRSSLCNWKSDVRIGSGTASACITRFLMIVGGHSATSETCKL